MRIGHFSSLILLTAVVTQAAVAHADLSTAAHLRTFAQKHCFDCHSADASEGGLDLDALSQQPFSMSNLAVWGSVYDRVLAEEMPPKNDSESNQLDPAELTAEERQRFAKELLQHLVDLDRADKAETGRSVWRRMNRYEYENSLRELLDTPWLQLKTILPEDGVQQRFNKIGEALDVSHVNLARYMQAADYALRESLSKHLRRPATVSQRFYARQQSSFNRRVHYTVFNRSPERATFPLIDYAADLNVLRDPKHPFTVGDSDPVMRERESMGVVASSYEPIEVRFSSFTASESGRYRLRFKGYTFWAAGEDTKWWRPDREKTSRGRRSEPVAIYSVSPPRQLRKLGEFDFEIEPSVRELEVYLLAGESIQVDATRLFRSRPSNYHNPLAESDGMPGVAFSYMEAEGPLYEQWPTRGQQLLFGELPLIKAREGVAAQSADPETDARRLLTNFLSQAYHGSGRKEASASQVDAAEVERFVAVVKAALGSNLSFQEAMLAGYTAVLCSPEFLCLQEQPGRLSGTALAARLSLFLSNSLPDPTLRTLADQGQLHNPEVLKQQVLRLLDDAKSRRFVDAFLAYWLDLRKINDTSPDELLYPDYYLDDALVDAALLETQLFFFELLRENLPARSLVDADFTFANERLARHYQLPQLPGVAMRRVTLPDDSPRGGLLTHASVLKVTANGTTTSPVVRGVWINERILGIETPPPPKSVPAIEPDTRGATTIRQQLQLHRADSSCNGCHAIIDPVGFALENFDVAGGWRTNYRSLGEVGEEIKGFGKNGQPFTFRQGPTVDATGVTANGKHFENVIELKQALIEDERSIAKNLLQQLITYATGAPLRFSDRIEIEDMLDRLAQDDYRVKSMIMEIVVSDLFQFK